MNKFRRLMLDAAAACHTTVGVMAEDNIGIKAHTAGRLRAYLGTQDAVDIATLSIRGMFYDPSVCRSALLMSFFSEGES